MLKYRIIVNQVGIGNATITSMNLPINGTTNNVVGSYMQRHATLVRQTPNTKPRKRHANRDMF